MPSQVAVLQPACSGMMNRVSSPSAPLLTLGHHVKACTNQAKVPLLFYSPEHMQQADTQTFTQNRCKHAHTCEYTYKNINKIKQNFVHLRALNKYTCRQTHAYTSVIHAMMLPLPWEGLLQHPQPAFLTDSYKKKTHYKTMSSRENQGNIWTGNSTFLCFLSKKITEVNSMLLADSAEAQSHFTPLSSWNAQVKLYTS